MTRLALIRHGHTPWNRLGRIQGRSDIALDDGARAELAAQKLPETWYSADLVSSPLLRAVETGRLISPRFDAFVAQLDAITGALCLVLAAIARNPLKIKGPSRHNGARNRVY